MRYISLYLFRFFLFEFVFWFLWNHATGLPEALHSYLYSFLILELQHLCALILNHSLVSDVDSCDEDGDEADEGVVVEELADIPGTINGTSSIYCNQFACIL